MCKIWTTDDAADPHREKHIIAKQREGLRPDRISYSLCATKWGTRSLHPHQARVTFCARTGIERTTDRKKYVAAKQREGRCPDRISYSFCATRWGTRSLHPHRAHMTFCARTDIKRTTDRKKYVAAKQRERLRPDSSSYSFCATRWETRSLHLYRVRVTFCARTDIKRTTDRKNPVVAAQHEGLRPERDSYSFCATWWGTRSLHLHRARVTFCAKTGIKRTTDRKKYVAAK